jgi:hypothetical protein
LRQFPTRNCKPALDHGAVDAMHWQFLDAVRLRGVVGVKLGGGCGAAHGSRLARRATKVAALLHVPAAHSTRRCPLWQHGGGPSFAEALPWTTWLTAVNVTPGGTWGCIHGGNRRKFGRIRSGPRFCVAPNASGTTRLAIDRRCDVDGLGGVGRLGPTSQLTALYGKSENRSPLSQRSKYTRAAARSFGVSVHSGHRQATQLHYVWRAETSVRTTGPSRGDTRRRASR